MTARVKSHDSRNMGGHTRSSLTHRGWGVEVVREWEEFYWVGCDVLPPVTWLPFAPSPRASRPLSRFKPHANQLSVLPRLISDGLFSAASHWIDNHCVRDQHQQILSSLISNHAECKLKTYKCKKNHQIWSFSCINVLFFTAAKINKNSLSIQSKIQKSAGN